MMLHLRRNIEPIPGLRKRFVNARCSGLGTTFVQQYSQSAVFQDINPQTGALITQWNGDTFDWDLNTGKIKTRGTTILAPRR